MVTSTLTRDEVVIGQEEQSQDVFFVREGVAQVTVYSADGREVAFRTIRAGQVFGELSAIDARPRSASVVAISDRLVVGRLKAASFRGLVEKNPDFMWRLLEHLSSQVRDMTDRIYEYSTKLVRERLILELHRLALETGNGGNTAEIRPAPTHLDLSARISCHREAVSREMSRLTKKGLIRKRDGAYTVTDIEGLLEQLPKED